MAIYLWQVEVQSPAGIRRKKVIARESYTAAYRALGHGFYNPVTQEFEFEHKIKDNESINIRLTKLMRGNTYQDLHHYLDDDRNNSL